MVSQSFTYRNGQYSSFTLPGALAAAAFGINDVAQIVGIYADASQVIHGFVDTAGAVTNVDFPAAKTTLVSAINVSGKMVGVYLDANCRYAYLHFQVASPTPMFQSLSCFTITSTLNEPAGSPTYPLLVLSRFRTSASIGQTRNQRNLHTAFVSG
jgi:hypothetical protein